MDRELPPADLERIRTHRLDPASRKVRVGALARDLDPVSATLPQFLDALPDLLAVRELRGLAAAVVQSGGAGRPVVWALGAHVVKAGLSPVLIRMMRRRRVDALVLNGAVAIHDWELAAVGATSEDVGRGLADGSFGMSRDTGRALNGAAVAAAACGEGLGQALARRMAEADLPHAEVSLLVAAARLGVPVTVHVALGCDIVHAQPGADGAAIGAASLADFRRLVTLVSRLGGGVWINCGSAVQLPEVFLKALSAARNLGAAVDGLTTANLDMIPQYRTEQNVLRRPTAGGGRAFRIVGHHELTLPLLEAAVEHEAQDPGGESR